jgi:hypothetical protein
MEKVKTVVEKKHAKDTFEIIWRNIGIVLIGVLLYCIPKFLSFREVAL